MRDMAHSICIIKVYQITMRKKFDFLFLTNLKHNFSKRNSHTLILATCYSSMQSNFKINLILTSYSMFNFNIENHEPIFLTNMVPFFSYLSKVCFFDTLYEKLCHS